MLIQKISGDNQNEPTACPSFYTKPQARIAAIVHAGWRNRPLTDAQPGERFDLAYNAAHAFSLAALRWHGYRSENRYLVFDVSAHTLNLPAPSWRVLDDAHRKRNLAEYEDEIEVDDALLIALLRVANDVATRICTLPATPPDDERKVPR